MATERIIYVDTSATGANDGTSWSDAYTGLQLAIDSEATDITFAGSDEIHLFLCESTYANHDTAVVVSGYTTSPTNKVIISAASNHNGVLSADTYTIAGTPIASVLNPPDGSNGGRAMVNVGQTHLDLELIGLQINYNSSATIRGLFNASDYNNLNIKMDRCLMWAFEGSNFSFYGGFVMFNCQSSTGICQNTLIHNVAGSSSLSSAFYGVGDSNSKFRFFNCTADVASHGFRIDSTNDVVARNIILSNLNNEPFEDGTSVPGDWDYIAVYNSAADSQVTTVCNTGVILSAAPYTDLANDDFSLASGNELIDAAEDLSNSGVTTDVAGVSRPQGPGFDYGAYEAGVAQLTKQYLEQARILNIT